MARRLFNGNAFSEDGWPYVDEAGCTWIEVPGTNVHLAIQTGPPVAIMGAVAADFNAYVEPLRDPDSACWTPGNSVATSNHPGATAMDLNWDTHKFEVVNTFNPAQRAVISEIVDFYEGMIGWAGPGYWQGGPVDEMHWQMGYGTYDRDNDRPEPTVLNFIGRKIRSDGFSTFRRGGVVTPPPPPVLSRADRYSLLIIAEGQRRGITPRGIEIALATALVESNIQIYANERVPASMSIPHDAVGSDAYSVGIFQQQVRDTGNGWWWGDAATCMDPTSSAGLFYDRLAKLDYNNVANSPGSYAQAVQSSAFPDRYDQRWGDATDIYNRLATTAPPTQGDDMAAVPQDQWDRVYRELTQRLPSRSPLRHLDQTQYYPDGLVDTVAGFTLNVDGMTHVQYVQALASYGHPPTLALLREVASAAGDSRYPDRQDDAKLAQAILADVTSAPPATPALASAATTTGPSNAELEAGYRIQALQAELDSLRAENARLQAAVSTPPTPAVLPAVVEPTAPAMTSGDHAGKVIDSVEDWTQHILAMDTPQRAAFITSMKALELPNGSQL